MWSSLPIVTRIKLADAFGIKKTGPTHVSDNHVQSDGYRIADVETALSVEALQEFTNSRSPDQSELWALTLQKINDNNNGKPSPSKDDGGKARPANVAGNTGAGEGSKDQTVDNEETLFGGGEKKV